MWARADDSDVLAMTGIDKNNRFIIIIATELNYHNVVWCHVL